MRWNDRSSKSGWQRTVVPRREQNTSVNSQAIAPALNVDVLGETLVLLRRLVGATQESDDDNNAADAKLALAPSLALRCASAALTALAVYTHQLSLITKRRLFVVVCSGGTRSLLVHVSWALCALLRARALSWKRILPLLCEDERLSVNRRFSSSERRLVVTGKK